MNNQRIREMQDNLKELDSILTEMEQPFALFNFAGVKIRAKRLERLRESTNKGAIDIHNKVE